VKSTVKTGLKHLVRVRPENKERLEEFFGINRCLYVPNPAQAVRDELTRNLRAQNHAINATVEAIRSWEFSRNSKSATPLVLALTGPTGAGKTETSNLIAEALFVRKEVLGGRSQSQGLLLFRGEDFTDTVHKPLMEYHRRIKSELAAHLKKCSGRAVVVFDEVQKVIPGTLDVLDEAMSDRPVLTHATAGGVQEKHDCSEVIFILVSDIGVDSIMQVMDGAAARAAVEQSRLRAAVKKALDAQWQRLQFGKAISEVVAFLPFEPADIEEIVQLKFEQLAEEHRGRYWRDLVGSDGLFRHLASDKELYGKRPTVGKDGRRYTRFLAKYGARNVVNGGPLQRLKAKLMSAIDLSADEDGVYGVGESFRSVCGGVAARARPPARPPVHPPARPPAAAATTHLALFALSLPRSLSLTDGPHRTHCAHSGPGRAGPRDLPQEDLRAGT
jgi:hypothetical protein